MKDTDFVGALVPELVDDYQKIKGYVADIPTQALLQIRVLAHKLTNQLAKDKISFTSPNLYERIEQLNQHRLIDIPTTRALHKLRGHGNRGAHPEKYYLTNKQLQTLARKAIKDCLSLFEHLYYKWHRQAPPEYQYNDTHNLCTKELCYRAVMEDDSEAQYLLGMALKSKGLMAQIQDQALMESKTADSKNSANDLAKAVYWFKQAAKTHTDALFELAVAYLNGYSGQKDVHAGERIIEQTAKQGNIEAQALLGYFYLIGSQCFTSDLVQAEYFLQQAAIAGNSEAMSNLGVLYYQNNQQNKAFKWISCAAKAGFANAQYHLSLMLAQGEACSQDIDASEHWLAEAAEQGQLDAMLQRARQMLNQDNALGQELSQAEDYLQQVIRYGHSVPAMLELSTALADGVLGRIDVVGAAALLKLAKGQANQQEIQIITPLWDSLVQQIDNVLPLTQNSDEQKALKRAKELLTD